MFNTVNPALISSINSMSILKHMRVFDSFRNTPAVPSDAHSGVTTATASSPMQVAYSFQPLHEMVF